MTKSLEHAKLVSTPNCDRLADIQRQRLETRKPLIGHDEAFHRKAMGNTNESLKRLIPNVKTPGCND